MSEAVAAGIDSLAEAYTWPDARERMEEFLRRKERKQGSRRAE